jgi:hypothetical protein
VTKDVSILQAWSSLYLNQCEMPVVRWFCLHRQITARYCQLRWVFLDGAGLFVCIVREARPKQISTLGRKSKISIVSTIPVQEGSETEVISWRDDWCPHPFLRTRRCCKTGFIWAVMMISSIREGRKGSNS